MYLLIFALVTTSLFSQSDFESDSDFFSQDIDSEYFVDEAPSKPQKVVNVKKSDDYFDDDPIYSNQQNQVQSAKADGIDRAFYPNGRLKYEIGYRGGLKDGMEKIFYPDGKLKSETGYRDGRKDGMEKLFYSDGKLKSETNYRNDRKSGFEKTFYSNGQFRSEIEYRNGKKIRTLFGR